MYLQQTQLEQAAREQPGHNIKHISISHDPVHGRGQVTNLLYLKQTQLERAM